ncbi:urea ABC transporter permease subunit UrtC [Acuticoccus sp. MNP-M23]|uniref:urea ABC transporter permease subunit UrtC n=1 Tax=Acuticoccus sp. MNP-M23 TaxID=3072793 RepID=UPI0028163588|nr:urea ABC transporter permease subunit UrtC [Acuticoccus sp. MNP-M23]WMS41379.1 urea ABC transporter permease subunit UrtC [Acuticoccus sp. MNP-M23]
MNRLANRYFTPSELLGFVVLAAIIFVVLPSVLDVFRLNLFGKYLTYAFVALGLVLCWGAGGILSLGQGVFFGLGGYCMAMFLKLEASSPENTSIQSTPGIPDFMDWNQITEIPWWWQPFHSLPVAMIAVVLVPVALAFIIGVAMFRRRVGGVYFAIITQAIAAILTILIIGQQGFTGGVNGITDLRTLLGWDIRTDSAKVTLYFVNGGLLFACLFIAHFVRRSKLGRLLIAIRDREDRVRFSGYDVANFKIFIFCLGCAFAGIGGAMFTLQVGFMSPSFVGIVPSIEMVIFCAVGGRYSIFGAVYGTLLVNWTKTTFSESFPELWLFAMGALFIGVVLAFPSGLAGLWTDYVETPIRRLRDRKTADRPAAAAAQPNPAE